MIERPDVPRSKFIGSWTRKTTFNAGLLVPFLVEEVLPGDHLKYDVTAYVRMSTPLFPMFDNQRVDTFFFFVPCRLVWSNWRQFMGQQATPASSIDFTIPQVTLAQSDSRNAVGTLFDYFGVPVGNLAASQSISVNALPFRAYNLIYNEWFRDQNLVNSVDVATTNGPDSNSAYNMLRRAKAHDYFNTCLPWPQKFTAPNITATGPVQGIGILASNVTLPGGSQSVRETGGVAATYTNTWDSAAANMLFRMDGATAGASPNIRAQVDFSVNVFRQAMLVQQLLERDARGGTRYTEIVKSHFGVTSPDARLQRPEYIGGGSSPLQLTPIAQTATGGGGLGAIGAAGTAVGSHNASYASTEHGYIIGLINVRSELSYSQGLHRMWTRSTRYDFYWPSLAQLGEQAVLRQEIFCNGVDADDQTVFGYQERWHEYRTRTSEVTGAFRPTYASNIDEWHLSEQFSGAPVLGQTFIEDNPPMDRVLAAGATARTTFTQYLADILIRREAVRPLPMYGTPVRLGRF